MVFGKTMISVSASDNYGINKVEIFIDGALKSTLTGSTYQYNWNTRSVSSGIHAILAKATYTGENYSQVPISVTRK
jgi:hypothetical protein